MARQDRKSPDLDLNGNPIVPGVADVADKPIKKVGKSPDLDLEGNEIITGSDVLTRVGDSLSGFMKEHPRIREMGERLLTGTSPEFEQMKKERGIKDVITSDDENSLLPDWKSQPETYWGGFAKSIYQDFVQPQFTPSGVVGNSAPGLGFGGKGRFRRPPTVEDLGPVSPTALPPAKIHVDPEGTAYRGDFPIRRSREVPYRSNIPTVTDITPITQERLALPPGRGAQDFTVPEPIGMPIRRDVPRFEPEAPPAVVEPEAIDLAPIQPETPVAEAPIVPAESEMMQKYKQALERQKTAEEPQASRVQKTNQDPRWVEAKADADKLGIDTSKYPDIEELEWAITQKVARETLSTGKNPLHAIDPNEPQAARTSSGKLKMGLKEAPVIQILRKFYEGDPSTIAVKELMQNSIDEINTAHPDGSGSIDVKFNDGNATTPKSVMVRDNGRGMTREQIETIYTDIGDTGKKSSETVGGFGVAKAAILLGGERVEVTTTAKNPKTGKYETTMFETSPEDLVAGKTEYMTVEAAPDTPLGTQVQVTFPKSSEFYKAKEFVENLTQYSTGKGSITMEKYKNLKGNPIKLADKQPPKQLAKINSPEADYTISIPTDATTTETNQIKLVLTNKGMFQGVQPYSFEHPIKVPDTIIVDISSKVDALHDDYPFSPSRERLKYAALDKVKEAIDEHLVNASRNKRKEELTKLYESMPEYTVGAGEFPETFGHKISAYDPKGQLRPDEIDEIIETPAIQRLTTDIVKIIGNTMRVLDNPIWADRLEKVGIIFNSEVHGIHIPNPLTKKSAILINPFQTILRNEPDQAAASIFHTILHEIAHVEPRDMGHNESFAIRLADIYTKFGARNAVAAQDRILASITDPNTGDYNSEISDVLQRYTQSRGREGTTEDLLSGTGIKQATRRGGEGRVSKDSGSDGRGTPTQKAVGKLLKAIRESRGLREEQESMYKTERARRFAEFESVKTPGMAGAKKSMGKMRGEYEKVDNEVTLQMNQKDIDTLFNAIKVANISTGEKMRGYTSLFKMLEGGPVPQRGELKVLDDVFGGGFSDTIVELHGGLGMVGVKVAKAANTMKALMSTSDLSAPLKQGMGLVHRKEWRDSVIDMLKYMKSEDNYNSAMEAIERRPKYLLGRQAGLFLAKPDDMLQGEDAFMNNYIADLPKGIKGLGIRDYLGVWERAYVGFLNKLRSDTFDSLTDLAQKAGHPLFTTAEHVADDGSVTRTIIPSKVTENLAKYINVSTGRGSLGRFEKIAPELNMVLWSPRLLSRTFTMLNPKYYMDLDPFTRKEAIKSLFAVAGASTIMRTLGVLAGGSVTYNILSSDFLKNRFSGDKVVDPNAGFQQPIVAAARIIEESNRMRKGETKPYGKPGVAEIGWNFTANKFSPIASLAHDLVTARKFTGEGGYEDRYGNDKSIQAETAKRFIPIFSQDVYDVLTTDEPLARSIGLNSAAFIGLGVQDYPERTTERDSPLKMRKMRLN